MGVGGVLGHFVSVEKHLLLPFSLQVLVADMAVHCSGQLAGQTPMLDQDKNTTLADEDTPHKRYRG